MANSRTSSRASLLAGLRTGGVRTPSGVPHTAGPSVGFNIPQLTVRSPDGVYEQASVDHLADSMARQAYISQPMNVQQQQQPYTAGYGAQARFHNQPRGMNHYQPNDQINEQQARMQLQMMQMELLRLQAMAQMNQYNDGGYSAPQGYNARNNAQFNAYTAQALMSASYDRQVDASAYGAYGNVPMTAGIDGKFGTRTRQQSDSGVYNIVGSNRKTNSPPRQTTPLSTSKSDAAANWRRASIAESPSTDMLPGKGRPSPLSLGGAIIEAPIMAINTSEEPELADDSVSSKSESSSSPSTPDYGRSDPMSPIRDEATKKMLQSFGGKPVVVSNDDSSYKRLVAKANSQPFRQPRGPPAAVDELGDRNFASRIRKLAIGGLNSLLEARERRERPQDGALQYEKTTF